MNLYAMVSFNASRAIFLDHNLTASGWFTGKSVAAICFAFQAKWFVLFGPYAGSRETPVGDGGSLSLTPD
jgi:hypothetical protein